MKIKSIETKEIEGWDKEGTNIYLVIQTTDGRVFNIPIGEFEEKDEQDEW